MNNLLIGVLISAVAQVAEVENFSTAVSFIPENEIQVTEYLDEIDNRLVPVIVINKFFKDPAGRFSYRPTPQLKQALSDSAHFGRLVFMWDEIMLHGRRAGQEKAELLEVMQQVKLDYPGVEFAHIEAYAELYQQYMENYGKLTLFFDAEHIGFDCYGKFSGCGGGEVPEISQMIYLAVIYNAIKSENSNAKIFLVPGAFVHPDHYPTEMDTINQLQEYNYVLDNNKQHISGMGLFTWGDVNVTIGARNNSYLSDYIEVMLGGLKDANKYKLGN